MRRFALILLCLAPLALGQTAPISEKPTPPPYPCPFVPIDASKYGNQPFQNPPDISSVNGALTTTLNVQMTDPKTTTLGGCNVRLRSYNGQLVGPTLRVKPGSVMDINLVNKLPIESGDEIKQQIEQEASSAFIDTKPHSFNTTNLHVHGLHVSPSGNSDNVLLAIPPQTSFPYEIKVPANHPAGTFWYHAHAHGSTAIQVGSLMEGAIIIEDDLAKLPPSLAEATKREKVMVIQTALYNAVGEVDDITTFFPGPTTGCATLKQCTWSGSNRRMTINGQIVPIIKMSPGEVQRWRLIDSSFRESVSFALEGHTLHEIALDGIYLGRVDSWAPTQPLDLEPGYRSDVLVQAGKPGRYRLVDRATSGTTTNAQIAPAGKVAPPNGVTGVHIALRGIPEPENLLAIIEICDPKKDKGCTQMDMKLPTNEEMAKLNPFPGVNLQAQATGVQEAIFKLGSAFNVDQNQNQNYFQINYHAFNPSRVRYVKLGATDMWNLTTVGDPYPVSQSPNSIPPLPHVFHIHVNPFQVTRQDPQGNPEVVWKDTVLVPPGNSTVQPVPPQNPAAIQIYTQYTDYIGQFVMHCHILDHEDLGMMEIVEVVGEQPASSLPSHGGH